MQVYAAEVRRLKNLFLIFEGGFKQIGDDFEIVFVFAVGGGRHVNQPQLVHDVGHVLKSEGFGGIDF